MGSITALPWVASALADGGLAPGTVAAALLLLPVGHLLTAPAWGWLADRTDAATVLRWTTAGSTLAGLGLAAAPDAVTRIGALALLALFRGGVFPVGDGLTLRLLGADRRQYGQIRAAGSVVFAVVIALDGWIREAWPTGPLWIGAGWMGLAAATSWTLPRPSQPLVRPRLADLLRVARDPVLGPLALVAVLHGITLTSYDNLYALHLDQLGLPSQVAGASFALGVTVEVAVLWTARRWLGRIGPIALLALAVGSGIPRWWLTGSLAHPAGLVLTQALHGIGFGAYWAAGVAVFNERAPANLSASAQALFTTATFGLGYLLSMGLGSLVLAQADTRALFTGLSAVSVLATLLAASVAWAAARRSPPG